MGLMARLFRIGGQFMNDPIASADPQGFSPTNQGSWRGYRSVPVVRQPRTFTEQEVLQLQQLKAQLTAQLQTTSKAFDLLQQIEAIDVRLTEAYHAYKLGSAQLSLKKAQSAAATSAKLIALEPQYAQLSAGIQAARMRSDDLRQKLRAAR